MARPSLPQVQAANVAEVDWLSALDDAIFSRMPLRDMATMTTVSHRWPSVFAMLPRLRLLPATFNRRDLLDEDYCEDDERWLDALEG
ncbi:hypothetical protein E2562_022655 [Oryza meyeriana var. granulata]|uniref:F-box domain-containing protein n=1 Tax=Oryza meyeriana var. granulata TaxID=110450 RepID=A0A6G1DZV6_9ORYZ|nr:hypothetical protein E2562_022655 [Oryza meyeriana var. granulata]